MVYNTQPEGVLAEKMIPLFRPYYGKEEIDAISLVLRSRWSGMGPVTEEFEKAFAQYIGTKYAVGVNSGTAALNLAVQCSVKPGGYVITTPISFVSTTSAIVQNHCTPLFVDVDPHTMNLDPDAIPIEYLEKADAILPVHYSGRPADMAGIVCKAKVYDLKVIEDAAHATGASYKGLRAGGIGDIGCFSFHAVKPLSCGDGGMLTTNDEAVYERAKRLRWCGIDTSTWERDGWEYDITERGYKCHMNDITAAIGLKQLERQENRITLNNLLSQNYSEGFASGHHAIAPKVHTPPGNDTVYKSAWHLYPIQVWDTDRDGLYHYLKGKGVTAGVHYKPIYDFTAYREYKTSCPVADERWKKLLSLPIFPWMEIKDQRKIIKLVKEY